MTGDDRYDCNLCATRELLLAAFSAEELRTLIAYEEGLGPLRWDRGGA